MATKRINLHDVVRSFFEQLADTIEDVLLMLASRFGPWLAPIGPAYFVGRAAYHHLSAHWLIAVTMAVAVEAVGIAATHTALKAWAWNGSRRKTDPVAPFGLMVWLSIIYFISALILSILVEVYPQSATYAPAVFIGLAAVAYVTIAVQMRLQDWHKARKSEVDKRTEEKDQVFNSVKAARIELDRIQAEMANSESKRRGLEAEIKQLQKTRATVKKSGTDDLKRPVGANYSDRRLAQARAVYDQLTAEKRKRFGSEMGRRLGISERAGRELKRRFDQEDVDDHMVDLEQNAVNGTGNR